LYGPRYGLNEAFDIFYSAKKAEGMRPRTLQGYVAHWRYFRKWFDVLPGPSAITSGSIRCLIAAGLLPN